MPIPFDLLSGPTLTCILGGTALAMALTVNKAESYKQLLGVLVLCILASIGGVLLADTLIAVLR